MAKDKIVFTDKMVKGFKEREREYLVSEIGGLYLRVLPSGRKVWMTVYSFGSRRRWFKLGVYPCTSLNEAHERLRACKVQLDAGLDPAEKRQRERLEQISAYTVKDLCIEYMEKWAKPRKKTWREDQRIIDKDILPVWGGRKAKDISRRDVILFLEAIVERGAPIQSNNAFALVRKMFNFAVERGVVDANPCLGVKPLAKRVQRQRTLSEGEIKVLWEHLADKAMSDDVQRVLKLILVTAQRPGEVVGLHSSEVDGNWWTVPAERAKNGKKHRVYLSPLALELIGDRDGYVFESPKRGQPIAVNALSHAVRRFLGCVDAEGNRVFPFERFTPHDLRRTAASLMASLGYGPVVGKILNHTDTSVTAIYDRYSYDLEKQRALRALSRKLEQIIFGVPMSNVVEL